MKIAYVTTFNAQDIHAWSGTGYYIGQSLKNQDVHLELIGPLEDKFSHKAVRKVKRHYYEYFNQKYLKDPEPFILKDFARQIEKKLLGSDSEIIFSVTANPIAYSNSQQPIVFYADATFAGLSSFYPHYSNLCKETVQAWHRMEKLALEKCKLAIYASDWAAQTAIDNYGVDPNKVKVVPLGANLENSPSRNEVEQLIKARPKDVCKLLFLGVDWYRKGGDIAFKVAEMLNASGVKVELTIVGCDPVLDSPLPDFVRPLGFISKSTPAGKEKISQLLAESHFLILPTRAECYGLVFCEANAFGVPCIGGNVGGVPTIIKENLNGKLFDETAAISSYHDYISKLLSNYSEYEKLAFSSFDEYNSRLNWNVAGKALKKCLFEVINN